MNESDNIQSPPDSGLETPGSEQRKTETSETVIEEPEAVIEEPETVVKEPEAVIEEPEIDKKRQQEHCKGKLKIFFGYASGIGKTYAMLSSALVEHKAGLDVVAGYIEPDGRPETRALVQKLEQIPLLSMEAEGKQHLEFDLDAALLRKPDLILVDEMARVNSSSCRHENRYEDIEELLNAGIDVYTTVNVQHIESLHDLIAALTGLNVVERIPDTAFDNAAQIEMVDITPEELLTRLRQGNFLHKEKVDREPEGFFTMEHLTALREVALRKMADWVNDKQESAGPLPGSANSTEHILMCLSPSPSNPKVIRQAARMAAAFHGKFTAFYVETPDYTDMTKEDLERLRSNTKLAQQLGAKAITSYGRDIVQQIAEYAKAARVTKIVLGRSYTRRSPFSMKESFSSRLSRIAPQLEIFIIPDSYEKKYKKSRHKAPFSALSVTSDTGLVAAVLAIVTGISFLFEKAGFSESNLIMVYMLGVLAASLLTRFSFFGVVYGLASILAFNFFFTAPKGTFHVSDPGYLITFLVMLATSVMISTLVRQVRESARQAAKKAYRTEILLETSQKLQRSRNAPEIAQRTVNQLGKLLSCNIYCFLGKPMPDSEPIFYRSEETAPDCLPKDEMAIAGWTYKNNKRSGATTTTFPMARCLYLTIRNGDKVFAVAAIELTGRTLPAFEEGITLAILSESALAFEREELVEKEQQTSVRLEQEQLRANLLRSISHDLRTPLTSIMGNADMLAESGDSMESPKRKEIYLDIYDDSMWLINLVENLLSVTRIENGTMKLNIQPQLVDDVITEAMKHINRKVTEHEIIVSQEDDMLVAKMDAKLIMQVLINLVDNAVKYTQKGSRIELKVKNDDGTIVFSVSDDGPGIPAIFRDKIFTMFYTGDRNVADGRRGMGLGLALCKAIVEAHGGEIRVENRIPCGTRFVFTLKAEEVTV